jgi:hypothetical protein
MRAAWGEMSKCFNAHGRWSDLAWHWSGSTRRGGETKVPHPEKIFWPQKENWSTANGNMKLCLENRKSHLRKWTSWVRDRVIRVLLIYELGMMEFHMMEFDVNKDGGPCRRGSHHLRRDTTNLVSWLESKGAAEHRGLPCAWQMQWQVCTLEEVQDGFHPLKNASCVADSLTLDSTAGWSAPKTGSANTTSRHSRRRIQAHQFAKAPESLFLFAPGWTLLPFPGSGTWYPSKAPSTMHAGSIANCRAEGQLISQRSNILAVINYVLPQSISTHVFTHCV